MFHFLGNIYTLVSTYNNTTYSNILVTTMERPVIDRRFGTITQYA